MPIAKLKSQISRLKTTNFDSPVPDEREAVIDNLKRALDEERTAASALRATVDDLNFKNATLETSYSKQLNDARERSDATEFTLAELQAQLDEAGGVENIVEVLAATRAELERITSERDRLRLIVRQAANGECLSNLSAPANSQADTNDLSIDDLLEDAMWAQTQSRIDRDGADAALAAVEETLPEDMVCPDLIFPDKLEDG